MFLPIMTGLTGLCVCVAIVAIGVVLIVRARKLGRQVD
jgi:hypothetical protein